MASTAAEYAKSIADQIWEKYNAGNMFGFYNSWDGSTVETLEDVLDWEDIPKDERDDYDADNLPGYWEQGDGTSYMESALDILYIVDSNKNLRDAQICITLGGPNAWIHTVDAKIHVWWGFEYATEDLPRGFIDTLREAAAEFFENT